MHLAAVSILGTALAVFSQAVPGAAQARPAQQVHRRGFEPARDEIFAVVSQFFDFDADLPLDARSVDTWETEHACIEKVVFTTSTGERVPGDLAMPREGEPPFPCVILVHGLGSSRDRWWREDRKALPEGLLEAGIAVFALDLRYHGERSASNDYEPPVYLTLGNTLFVRSRDMVIQSTIDCRRALAYLLARAEIDSARIGVVGYSMGGMIALILSALEEGPAGFVACAVPTTEQPLPIDHFNFAARSRAPTLLLIGREDWLSSPEDARMLHDLLPVSDKRLSFLDGGHALPREFTSEALAWLRDRLIPVP